MRRAIVGKVLGPDGRPAAGAAVFLIGQRNCVLNVPLPRDQNFRWAARIEILARAQTDADGAFSLSADYDPDRYQIHNGGNVALLVKALGAGKCVQTIKQDVAEITLRLAPEVVIHGRLSTPSGLPASDVRVTLDGWRDDQTEGRIYLGMTPTDTEIPSFWLQPRKTDADGRFTLEGLPQDAYAALTFWHPDYAVDDVTVHTRANGSVRPQSQSPRIAPVAPKFTHTLEIARPVQGLVTDKETGQPLVGLQVEMIPMRSDCGWVFHTRTDANGRYRVSGHGGALTYFTTVYPPADSGYLAVGDNRSWPTGAKVLEKNFALDKGRIVRGQIIDADTRQPIAGAAIVYQPTRDNPNNRKYDLRNTVLTNSEGRFAITTLPGQGSLAIETADESYTRVPFDESYPYRKPTSKVHGKLVTAGGTPMRPTQVHPMLVIRDHEGEMSRDDIFRNMLSHSVLIAKRNHPDYLETLKSNARGEFVIDTLISGVRLCIFAEENDRQALAYVPPLRPGEDRDLGTITLKERKP